MQESKSRKWNVARRDAWHQEYELANGDLSLKAGIYRRAGIPVHAIELCRDGSQLGKITLDTADPDHFVVNGDIEKYKTEIRHYLDFEGLTPVARRNFHDLMSRI